MEVWDQRPNAWPVWQKARSGPCRIVSVHTIFLSITEYSSYAD